MFLPELILLPIIIIGLAIFFFELFMFLDVIKNKKLSDTEKLLWGLGILLFHPFVAVAYFLIVYSKKA